MTIAIMYIEDVSEGHFTVHDIVYFVNNHA